MRRNAYTGPFQDSMTQGGRSSRHRHVLTTVGERTRRYFGTTPQVHLACQIIAVCGGVTLLFPTGFRLKRTNYVRRRGAVRIGLPNWNQPRVQSVLFARRAQLHEELVPRIPILFKHGSGHGRSNRHPRGTALLDIRALLKVSIGRKKKKIQFGHRLMLE